MIELRWLKENSWTIATVIACIIIILVMIYAVNSLIIEARDWTYDQCMISKMHSRPSSMHEIISEYCKKDTKPIVQFHDMDTTEEEDR